MSEIRLRSSLDKSPLNASATFAWSDGPGGEYHLAAFGPVPRTSMNSTTPNFGAWK